MTNHIRPWAYWLVFFWEKIVSIKKTRGPFTGLLDLPGWKIEYFESHKQWLIRELQEEIGVWENDIEIEGLLCVEEEFVTAFWDWKNRTEHILAIVYKVKIINPDFNIHYIEDGGDAGWIQLIDKTIDSKLLTPIFSRIIKNS